MLYDPRWEKRPEQPPPQRHDWLCFFVCALVPVFVASYAVADTYHDVAYLLWPLGANGAAIALTWLTGR